MSGAERLWEEEKVWVVVGVALLAMAIAGMVGWALFPKEAYECATYTWGVVCVPLDGWGRMITVGLNYGVRTCQVAAGNVVTNLCWP